MKAMTIKALQARQAAAAAATAKSMEVPAQIASPWQGVSHLAGILGSEYSQNKVDSAESDARNRLAALKAQINPETGATSQQLADIGQLDQDFADKEFARLAAAREAAKLETQREAHDTSERIGGQQFSSGQTQAGFTEQEKQAATQVKANQDAAAAQVKANQDTAAQAATTAADAAKTLAQTQAEQALTNAAYNDDLGQLEARRQKGLITPEDYATQKDAILNKLKPEIWNVATPAQMSAAGYAPSTPGQISSKTNEIKPGAPSAGTAAANTEASKQILEFNQAGGPNAQKAITQVGKTLDLLQHATGAGGLINITGIPAAAIQEIGGDTFSKFVNPQGHIAQDAIRETVQTTLRQVLGAQFTQQEGEALMARAFDIAQTPQENIRRAKILLAQVGGIAKNKQSMADWYNTHHNDISGWTPPQTDTSGGEGSGAATPDTSGWTVRPKVR
jgi:hypothetical protein